MTAATPGQIARDCITVIVITGAIVCLAGGIALHGMAGAIEAFGDAFRAVLG